MSFNVLALVRFTLNDTIDLKVYKNCTSMLYMALHIHTCIYDLLSVVPILTTVFTISPHI